MPGSLDAVGRPTPESAHRTPNDAVLVQNRRQNIDAAHPAHCIVDGVRRGRNRRWRNAVAGLVGPTRAGAGIASIVALPMPPPLASASAGPPLPLMHDATGGAVAASAGGTATSPVNAGASNGAATGDGGHPPSVVERLYPADQMTSLVEAPRLSTQGTGKPPERRRRRPPCRARRPPRPRGTGTASQVAPPLPPPGIGAEGPPPPPAAAAIGAAAATQVGDAATPVAASPRTGGP